jgi:hypothetical protein
MSSKPILFYSKVDQRSINLWSKLSKESRLNDFIKICVDNNNKIPNIIRTVPVIYIKGRPVIEGAAISMFLNNMQPSNETVVSQDRSGNPSQHPSLSKQPTQQSQESGELNDFNPVEMSNRWSDAYSFIQDNPEPLSFSFQFLQNDNSPVTTNSEQPNSVKQEQQGKNRSGEFQNRLEAMQNARNGI